MVVVMDNKRALLIDTTVPADATVEEKDQEKMDRYQELTWELKRLWKVETEVIPTVVGSLGTAAKGLEKNLKKAGSNATVELLQKAALLNIANTEKGTIFGLR